MRQEIVVYRSPAETALWDFATSDVGSKMVLWLFCAFIVVILAIFCGVKFDKFNKYFYISMFVLVTHAVYLVSNFLLLHL